MKLYASYQVQCWQTVLCSEIANFLNPQTVIQDVAKPDLETGLAFRAARRYARRSGGSGTFWIIL
jgi:hypothetical protein